MGKNFAHYRSFQLERAGRCSMASSAVRLDPAPAENQVAIVENGRLARTHGPLGDLELALGGSARKGAHTRARASMPVAGLDVALEGLPRPVRGNPVDALDRAGGGQKGLGGA